MAESSSLPIKSRALRLTGRELGRGAYGIVFEGKLGNESVAVKVIHQVIAFDKPREDFEKECNHRLSILRNRDWNPPTHSCHHVCCSSVFFGYNVSGTYDEQKLLLRANK